MMFIQLAKLNPYRLFLSLSIIVQGALVKKVGKFTEEGVIQRSSIYVHLL